MRWPSRVMHPRLRAMIMVWVCAIVVVTIIRSQPEMIQVRFGTDIETVTSGHSATETFAREGTYQLHEQRTHSGCELCESRVERVDQGGPVPAVHAFDFFHRYIVSLAPLPEAEPGESRRPLLPMQALAGRKIAVDIPPPKA